MAAMCRSNPRADVACLLSSAMTAADRSRDAAENATLRQFVLALRN
jgi:hypothetical protein